MPRAKIGPILLGALALAATHEGAWYGADPTGYKFVRLESHALNGLRPWMQVQLSTKLALKR